MNLGQYIHIKGYNSSENLVIIEFLWYMKKLHKRIPHTKNHLSRANDLELIDLNVPH